MRAIKHGQPKGWHHILRYGQPKGWHHIFRYGQPKGWHYIFLCAAAWTTGARAVPPQPDAIYHNGRVITMSERLPVAEAFAVAGQRFVAVGTNDDMLRTAGSETTTIDLKGRTVVPGLIDSHTHPIDAAVSELDGPLPAFGSIRDIQQYIRDRAARTPADRPILVPKIYASRLAERRYPTRQELDLVAPDRPALVDNGYSAVLNSVLLAKLEITRATPNPSNGKIGRDAAGEPTGLILGAPELLVPLRRRAEVSEERMLAAVRRMFQHYNRAGITSTIDRGQQAAGFRLYQRLRRDGALTVRTAVTYRIPATGSPRDIRQRVEAAPLTLFNGGAPPPPGFNGGAPPPPGGRFSGSTGLNVAASAMACMLPHLGLNLAGVANS